MLANAVMWLMSTTFRALPLFALDALGVPLIPDPPMFAVPRSPVLWGWWTWYFSKFLYDQNPIVIDPRVYWALQSRALISLLTRCRHPPSLNVLQELCVESSDGLEIKQKSKQKLNKNNGLLFNPHNYTRETSRNTRACRVIREFFVSRFTLSKPVCIPNYRRSNFGSWAVSSFRALETR